MFVLIVISILLMDLFTSHLRAMAQERRSRMKADEEMEAQVVVADARSKMIIDFHKDRGTVSFYPLSMARCIYA